MHKEAMMQIVFNQLSIDYNCSPNDFLKDEIIFTEAKELKGRRTFPFTTPRLELITFGRGLVINSSIDILEMVKNKLKNKSRFDILKSPFVCGINPYYLPNVTNMISLELKSDFEFEFIEKDKISQLYKFEGFDFALKYDINSLHTEELAVTIKQNNMLICVASAVSECETLWQINVDVLPEFRGNNFATIAVNMLTSEVLKREYVPYYSTDISNISSLRVAIKSGYLPSWSHCFRTRIDLLEM